jgi:hypothetical protein
MARVRRSICAAALACMGVLTTVPASRAGSYTELACSPTSSTGIFQAVNTFPEGLAAGNHCMGPAIGPIAFEGPTDEGALFSEDSSNTIANIPDGAEAGWLAVAPPGTTITAIRYYRSLHAYLQQSLVPGLWTHEGTALESCVSPPEGTHECNELDNQVPADFTGLNTTSLFFGVRCHLVHGGGEYCIPAAPGKRHAQADIYSAQITLSETSNPQLTSVSGSAWGGGVLSGQAAVLLSASDPSGIEGVEVRSSLGGVLASVSELCNYYQAIPCPNLDGASIAVDTTAAADGPQTLSVVARDAAGNTTLVSSPQVVVDNHGPPAPVGLVGSLLGNEVVLSWVNPPVVSVALAAATVTVCGGSCAPAVAVAASGLARIVKPGPGSYTLKVSLTDIAGQTSPAASVPLVIPNPPPPAKKVMSPPGSSLHAVLDRRGRLYVAGAVPRVSKGLVKVCWRSRLHGRTLGGRCTPLHVTHGRVSVTFHPTLGARRGQITVTVSRNRKVLLTLHPSRSS